KAFEQRLHARRQRVIRVLEAGKACVAAHGWDHVTIEHGDTRRLLHPGEIHVPVLAGHHPGVLGFTHEGDDIFEALHGLVDGIAAERPEAPRNLVERLRRQLLATNGDHMIVVQDPAKLFEYFVVGIVRKLDTTNVSAERAGEGTDFESPETVVAQHCISVSPEKVTTAASGT